MLNLSIGTTGDKLAFSNVVFQAKNVALSGNKKNTTLVIEETNGAVNTISNFKSVDVKGTMLVIKSVSVNEIVFDDTATTLFALADGCTATFGNIKGEGTIGIAAPAKKFKPMTIKAVDDAAKIVLVQINTTTLLNGLTFEFIVEGSFASNTQIITDKTKSEANYVGENAKFDATALKADDSGELTYVKGKVIIK